MVTFPYVLSALFVLYVVYEMAHASCERARTRAAELQFVETVLGKFYDSIEKIFDDPVPSDEMRSLLLAISEAISDRRLARIFGEISSEPMSEQTVSKASDLLKELDSFRKSRPDLLEAFSTAIRTGIVAVVYRWPENARRADEILSHLLVEIKPEVMTVYRFAQASTHFGTAIPA